MPYRFTLGSAQIECDTLDELLAATGASPARGTSVKTPTTKRRRARKSGSPHAAAHSWNVARFYSEKPRVNLSVRQARAHLAADPQLKARVEKEYAEANG